MPPLLCCHSSRRPLPSSAVPNDAGLTYGHVHLNVSDVELHKQLWVEHFGAC